MKNKAFYNTIKSALIMDQVFAKYAIYEKTYFGSLGINYDFTTTEGYQAYVDAPVWASGSPEGLYKRNTETTYKFYDGLRFDCIGKTRRLGLSVAKKCNKIQIKFKIDSYTATVANTLIGIFPWDVEGAGNIELNYALVGDNVANLQITLKSTSQVINLENYKIGTDNTLTLTIKKISNYHYIVNGTHIYVTNPKYTANNSLLGFNIASTNKADITSISYTIESVEVK